MFSTLLEFFNDKTRNFSRRYPLFGKIFIKINNFSIKIVTIIFAISTLKKMCKKSRNLREYVKIALCFTFSIFKDSPYKVRLTSLQNEAELYEFIKKIAKSRPKIILEIGTHYGGTFFLFSRVGSPNALLISVDLPTWNLERGYGRFRTFFYNSFRIKHQKMIFIAKDSHKPSTLQEVRKYLKNQKIDLLFIDGDHSYEGVKKDFEMYSSLVKNDGIIAFHDIVVHDQSENCEVNRFWNEIKKEFEYSEIVENWNQKHWGIGLLKYKSHEI